MSIPGDIQDFLDGLDILRPYAGGTTTVEAKGLTVHITDVNWPDISESDQDVLKKKGWVQHYDGNYPMWIAEG